MAVKTASFSRDPKSGRWKARRAIPHAIRASYAKEFGARHEAKASWPASLSEREARNEVAEWQALIERRFSQLREPSIEGSSLSHPQVVALAGQYYEWRMRGAQEFDPTTARWDLALEHFEEALDADVSEHIRLERAAKHAHLDLISRSRSRTRGL